MYTFAPHSKYDVIQKHSNIEAKIYKCLLYLFCPVTQAVTPVSAVTDIGCDRRTNIRIDGIAVAVTALCLASNVAAL